MNPFGHRVSEMSSTGMTSGLLPVVSVRRPRRESVVVMVKMSEKNEAAN